MRFLVGLCVLCVGVLAQEDPSPVRPARPLVIKASFKCVCPNRSGRISKEGGIKFYFRKQKAQTNFGESLGSECQHICRQADRNSRRRQKRQLPFYNYGPMIGYNSCACQEDCFPGGCSYDCAPPAPIVVNAPSPLWALAARPAFSAYRGFGYWKK